MIALVERLLGRDRTRSKLAQETRARIDAILAEVSEVRAAFSQDPVLSNMTRPVEVVRPRTASSLRWGRAGNAYLVEDWTPDKVAERNERLAWAIATGRRGWKLVNGQFLPGPHDNGEQLLADLQRAMFEQRARWRGTWHELAQSATPLGSEGTYGALGAYPLPAELASMTPTATEAALIPAASAAIYMPLPANGILAPQAYRFVVAGRVTTTGTAANYTWTPRLGNANTSPSLGASAAIAKTISIANAILIMKGDITIQSIGIPGANSKAIGHFDVKLNTAAAGAYTSWAWGSVASASFDSTVSGSGSANGGIVWLGVTASAAAADPFIIGGIHFMDWN